MKQHEAVIETLERLGGIATLGQLNQEVFQIDACEWKTKTPFASIRRIVQERPEIYKIKSGLWALESWRNRLQERGIYAEGENKKSDTTFTHAYYQGLLLEIGNALGKNTFVPNQDKNQVFAGGTLGDVRSLDYIPMFSYDNLVKRSSTIDVIWFNNRMMPNSFFEVEHSTDIQNSLLKYCDLQDFYTRMFIVADGKRYDEYIRKMHYEGFHTLLDKKRVEFLSYDKLMAIYNNVVQHKVDRMLFQIK